MLKQKNSQENDLKISWSSYERLCKQLHHRIEFHPDAILCINSGGLLVGKLLSEYMQKPLFVVSAKSYQGRERGRLRFEGISLLQKIRGDLLLVDDIVDSGKTLQYISKKVKALPGIRTLKTATLIFKPRSCFKPDYYMLEDSRWVIFPYENG